MNADGIYLARFGRTYGPYSESELTRLQAEGKLKDFSWIWDATNSAWKPLDPAPAPLENNRQKAPTPRQPQNSVQILSEDVAEPGGLIEAVCHNGQNYLSGRLEFMTETGCEFLSEHAEPYPLFAERNPVWLNLFETETGRLLNARARVCATQREGGGWKYRLRWEERPRFGREGGVVAS